MKTEIIFKSINGNSISNAYLISNIDDLPLNNFTFNERLYIKERIKKHSDDIIEFNRFKYFQYIIVIPKIKKTSDLEKVRRLGDSLAAKLISNKVKQISVHINDSTMPLLFAFAEGFLLGSYEYSTYKTEVKNYKGIETLILQDHPVIRQGIKEVEIITEMVKMTRDLINEPSATMNAEKFSLIAVDAFKGKKAKVEVLNKNKIEALKMGGLLGVNKGSIVPPTFTIIEYKPTKAVNIKPYVLVGKGVTMDTGGLNLKPGDSMTDMKSDMSGAAAVLGAMKTIVEMELPVYVVGLIPATDNRPGNNATAPGDVLTMFNGKTVEVLNTDAEGRLILADALAYAQKYDPMLVIDIATLTGAAHAAIGHFGIVAMHNHTKQFESLVNAGEEVHERLVELPFWDEYADLLKSKVADLKNIGGRYAGAITAGKFLENFTDYPYVHLDIAGPAYFDNKEGYITAGGSGVGVRLFYRFFRNIAGITDLISMNHNRKSVTINEVIAGLGTKRIEVKGQKKVIDKAVVGIKRRGRPKKKDTTEKIEGSRKRGRPKKVTSTIIKENQKTGRPAKERPLKAKRGRPVKQKPAEIIKPTQKKRGRPIKAKIAVEKKSLSRKRGRPAKTAEPNVLTAPIKKSKVLKKTSNTKEVKKAGTPTNKKIKVAILPPSPVLNNPKKKSNK